MRIMCCAAILHLVSVTAAATPFRPVDIPTLAEAIADGNAALVVEWIKSTEADVETDQSGESEYRIVHVIRDDTAELREGNLIRVPRHHAGARGDHFLLISQTNPLRGKWSSPRKLSPAAIEYVLQVPSPDIDARERLMFYANHIEHSDAIIAEDAFAEFEDAEYEDVAAVAGEFDAAQVRGWLSDEETHPRRLDLYGRLLGRLGDTDDAEFLRLEILRPTGDFRLGLEGMISGYLLITGESGLEVIEDSKLRNRDDPFSETYQAMQALKFMWTYADGEISRERLQASMRILLDRPELADLVINDLARWRDWSVAERLMELYGTEGYDIPSTKRAIVRYYLLAASEEDSSASPEQVRFAEACLAQLRESDPKTVQRAERFFLLLN